MHCLFSIFSVVGGAGTVDEFAELMNMDLVTGDMDVPVDFSSINVSDLMAYSK